MKTVSLTGFALDDAVIRALGGVFFGWTDSFMEFPEDKWPLEGSRTIHADEFHPSDDIEYGESQGDRGFGARLIKALNIAVQPNDTDNDLGAFIAGLNHEGSWHQAYGATALEAAMRALVMSRLGPEIEL